MNRNIVRKNNSMSVTGAVGVFAACVLGTVGAGWLSLLVAGAMGFAPATGLPMPGRVFSAIIWSVFFALLGSSLFLQLTAKTTSSAAKAVRVWSIGLWSAVTLLMLVWPLLMFRLQSYALAFVWLGVTASALSALIVLSFRLRPASAFLLLPLAAWVVYMISAALYLVISI